jgi:hypothetical protein
MRTKRDFIRLGSGSACAEDRIDSAVELAEKGDIDYLVFDSLSEQELAWMARYMLSHPNEGYDFFTQERLTSVLPVCARNRVKIIGNMGSRNPKAAQNLAIDIAQRLGLKGMRIAAVWGDDVLEVVKELNPEIAGTNGRIDRFGENLISAHAYVPADPIVEALRDGADVVLTGRVGDASLFLGPMVFEFGWKDDDWDLLAKGIVVGHLLECAGQVSGGCFADPPYKEVPDLYRLGFPLAEVYPNGESFITKVPGSGGMVTPATCTEQLLYETDDPSRYIEADVTTDFNDIEFEQVEPDRVRVAGVVKGKPKPELLKVCLGVMEGYMGEATVYCGGPGAFGRVKLAADILKKRFELMGLRASELRFDFLGVNGLYKSAPGVPESIPWEVGLRVAGITEEAAEANKIALEVGRLSCNGPAATPACRQGQVREVVGYYMTFIPRDKVISEFSVKEA